MASLCRTIEIDLRDMLDEKDLPAPIAATNNIMM
jgi:putative membrane protein